MVKVAYTVGRFQPPTIGHKLLIQKVIDTAGPKGLSYVFVSKAISGPKNPLTSAQKIPILKHMFPEGVIFVDTAKCDKPCGGPGYALNYLINQGHKPEDISFVVGKERLDDSNKEAYFGTEASVWGDKTQPRPGQFVSAGDTATREISAPSDDVKNMSGTKARGYVTKDDSMMSDFYTALGYGPDEPKADADVVYNVIKAKMFPQKSGKGRTMRKLKKRKASSRVLYLRGLRSRNGSSKTNRSSYGFRDY